MHTKVPNNLSCIDMCNVSCTTQCQPTLHGPTQWWTQSGCSPRDVLCHPRQSEGGRREWGTLLKLPVQEMMYLHAPEDLEPECRWERMKNFYSVDETKVLSYISPAVYLVLKFWLNVIAGAIRSWWVGSYLLGQLSGPGLPHGYRADSLQMGGIGEHVYMQLLAFSHL